MTLPQTAICAEGGSFAIFITATLKQGGEDRLRRAATALPALTAAVATELAEPDLVSSIAFGAEVWPRLFTTPPPVGLVPFAPLADGHRTAPATPADLFLHIHSPRHDANFHLARRIMAQLSAAVTLIEEVHGFRNQGGRDLTGFVDGTENPEGEERPLVALVGADDALHQGGSFVSIQRWVHDLARWESRSLAQQEAAVGRTKQDDQEMDDEVKPPSAHIARVVIEEDGEELAILRHSLPYGTTSECGLYFVAYGRSPTPFRRMLEAMVMTDAHGHHDRLMDFTLPVTGAAFFAPSQGFLNNQ